MKIKFLDELCCPLMTMIKVYSTGMDALMSLQLLPCVGNH